METNGLINGTEYHSAREGAEHLGLAELAARGGRITRVRLLSEVLGGYGRLADISYIHGILPDGTHVDVRLDNIDPYGIPMRAGGVQKAFVAWAKREGVYAKGIGLLDTGSWSVLS